MTSAFAIAMLAVAVSLGAVVMSTRSRKAAAATRQTDSDGGTTMMIADSGTERSPEVGRNTDIGGSDSGGDGGGGGD